jgi:hypothetical protein
MSTRKEPEDERAPAAAGAPPRLGDHSSYMPEPLVGLADVHIKVEGGAVLPAHAMALLQHCGALARSAELFADATSKAPVALSSPFDEYAEADVARFLRCIYTAAAVPVAEDIARPAVVRLEHALDAAPVLAAARRHLVERVRLDAPVKQLALAAELAALCGWDDVRAAVNATLLVGLQAPLGDAATPAQMALSDVDAFSWAEALVDSCSPELVKRLMATLGAPAVTDEYYASLVEFKSHGLDWELSLEPNDAPGKCDRRPVVGVALTRDCPKKVWYRVGLINLLGAPLHESDDFEDAFVGKDYFVGYRPWRRRASATRPPAGSCAAARRRSCGSSR